ncbi:MAG: ABC transporter ATP-binding protein [Ignavibacteria bacterium]
MTQASSYSVRDLASKMLPFVRPAWKLVIFSTIANLLFSVSNALILAVVEPIFRTLFGSSPSTASAKPLPAVNGLKAAFDEFISMILEGADQSSALRNISIVLFALFVVRGITKYVGSVLTTRLEEGIMKRIRDALFLHLTKQSLDFFSKRKAGEIISLLTNDIGILNHATVNSITILWRESSTVVIYVSLLFVISAKLTIISVSVAGLGLFLMRAATRLLRSYGARMQAAQADYTATLQEAVQGVRVVKAMNVESFIAKRFIDQTSAYFNRAVRNTRVMGLIPVVNDTFGILALITVFYIGSQDSAAGIITPSSLMTFLFLLFGLMQPISVIANTVAGMQRGIAAGANVASALDTEPTIRSGAKQVDPTSNVLSVRNVSFAYGDSNVLHNVSFDVQQGEKIAFVGASGSGKSTMLDLLLRFYDPQAGQVQVFGQDIREVDLNYYRRLFGVVSQEALLFHDTIANNISLGEDAQDMQQILNVAKIAHADEFVRHLPDGYDTVIGDRGMRLSGGQRQRLAIARALFREPSILMFDEATSALDTESERLVQTAIDEALVGRTAIIVAHRLSTIINADRIIVFDQGRVVEQGTHAELLARAGVYARLYEIQYAGATQQG